jgi:AraC-like DNA-binding protein
MVHAALQPRSGGPAGFGVSAKSVYRVVGMKSQSGSDDLIALRLRITRARTRRFHSLKFERRDQLRRSREVHKSFVRRTRPEAVSSISNAGIREKVYVSTKLAAVFDALVNQGASAEEILRGADIRSEEVHSPKTRISLGQLMTTYQNAIQLSADRHLPYRIGTTIHVSTYGMYGYAMLCCPDFRKAMDFAMSYHALAAPLATIEFREEGGRATWSIEPILHSVADRRLYRFIAELQIGIHISLMRDIMGTAFAPQEVCLSYPPADDFGITEELVGCSVRFAQPANRIVFKSEWLDQSATLGNQTTYPTILAMCDELLEDLNLRVGPAGKIRAILLRDIGNPPTFDAAAKLLDVNARSLRRQLRQQGMSFRGLRDELRAQLALKYLRSTDLANEDIAFALGFSDAANFRRAFHRWTNKSPSEVRGE